MIFNTLFYPCHPFLTSPQPLEMKVQRIFFDLSSWLAWKKIASELFSLIFFLNLAFTLFRESSKIMQVKEWKRKEKNKKEVKQPHEEKSKLCLFFFEVFMITN